jgi:hypothetical protein
MSEKGEPDGYKWLLILREHIIFYLQYIDIIIEKLFFVPYFCLKYENCCNFFLQNL